MTENQKAALAWARRNESRVEILAAQVRDKWRAPEDRARLSDIIDCLVNEASRFRAYAYDVNKR